MQNKNQKIGRGKNRKDRGKSQPEYRKFRVAEPGFEPLTIFAESPGQARSIARRLNGLRRLMADLEELRGELESPPEARIKPGLLIFYDRESRMQLAGPEFSGLRQANGGRGETPGRLQ